MPTKYCRSCKETKKHSEFNRNAAKKDGLGTKCRSCMALYKKQYYRLYKKELIRDVAERKQKLKNWLDAYKDTLSCKCGETHPATLDFHHLDRKEKEFSLATAAHRGMSLERIQDELKKCVVICSNCHRKLHWEEKLRVKCL